MQGMLLSRRQLPPNSYRLLQLQLFLFFNTEQLQLVQLIGGDGRGS